jgi:undecaprenyldiphospho-muramoylpentapeptide beta-N-acetylglucosaminyltransferase
MTANRARVDVLLTGGGTAGHVRPALAVARALVAAGHASDAIHFVGSARGMEARLVPEAGFCVTLLPGRGIERKWTARNVRAVLELAAATVQALVIVLRRRPGIVVAVAGYASVPTSLAAWLVGVPIVVVNIDSVPGAANRVVARLADASAVAFPGTRLPRAVVTGAPVGPDVLAIDRSIEGRQAARASLGISPEKFVVVVTGGSLGARSVNHAAAGAASLLADRSDVTLYHVAGDRDRDAVAALRAGAGPLPADGLDYRLVGYEPHMATVLGASDLVVARAGASTVAELTSAGIASVLVPLPGAPSDHQRRNAEVLEKHGAAVILDDDRCTAEEVARQVVDLAGDRTRLASMARAAAGLGHRDAAERVAAVVDQIAARGAKPEERRRGARRAMRRATAGSES